MHNPSKKAISISSLNKKKDNVQDTGRIANQDILQETDHKHWDMMISVLSLRVCISTSGRYEEKP